MRRAVITLTAVLVIIFSVQLITQITTIKGDTVDTTPPLGIESPINYTSGKVYQESSIDIIIAIHHTEITAISYSLDGNPNITLSILSNNNIPYSATGTMENLTNGYHFLEVYSFDSKGESLSTSTPFLVNTSFSYPKLLLSPLNITYNKNEVSLIYTVNEPAKYDIYYSLGNNSYPISSNTTLTGLSDGQYRIKLSAITHNGYLFSENTVYFEINTAKTEQSQLLFTTLAIVIVIVAVASISLVFFKRRKPKPA